MRPSDMQVQNELAAPIMRFLAHKRALGRGYDTEAGALRLFYRFLNERKVFSLEQVTPELVEAFMVSRPRHRPRSYNHLLATVRRLFEWLVQQEELEQSPVRIGPRRVTAHREPFIFDPPTARRLLALARELPDNPRASMRGATYHTLFAILYGLGLRVSEACRLQFGEVDLDWGFFLSVDILSTVFRGKLLDGLQKAVASGTIEASVGSGVRVRTLLRRAARPSWVVYAKPPFAGPEQVLAYLGRYTHRIAISNNRIVSMEGDEVTFHYKDRADADRRKSMTIPAVAFLRRFLLHVLPPGFFRIRHYGFLANSVRRKRIALCRRLLGVPVESAPTDRTESWEELLLRLTGEDVTRCPQCKAGSLYTTCEIRPNSSHHPTTCKEAPT